MDTTPTANVKDERIVRAIARHRDSFRAAVDQSAMWRLLWVKFKIIDGCNIKCVMCNHWRRDDYRRNALTPARMLALADELVAMGVRAVNWSGGEPTLRKDLPEIIERLSSHGIENLLITNGTLMTESYAARLRAARVSSMIFSLESADPEVHDRVVGIPGAWEKLVAGARYLRQGDGPHPKFSLSTVLTRLNTGPGLVDLVEFSASLGVTQINFMPVVTEHLTPAETVELRPTPEQVASFRTEDLPRMRDAARRLGVKIVTNGEDDPPVQTLAIKGLTRTGHIMGQYQQDERPCYLPFYHCTIDHNGNVVACCHMRDGDGLVGNITDAPLADILNGPAATRLRDRVTTPNKPDLCLSCAMQVNENAAIDRVLDGGDPFATA